MECYTYVKLRNRIKERYVTQEAFARELGISRGSLIGRLNGSLDFKFDEVVKSCELLDIPFGEATYYFFTRQFGNVNTNSQGTRRVASR